VIYKVINEIKTNCFWIFDLIVTGLQLCDGDGFSSHRYAASHSYGYGISRSDSHSPCTRLYPA
jgi:hypothetical protein